MSHKMTARLQKLDVAKVAMVVFLDKKLAVDGEKGGRYAVDPDHAKVGTVAVRLHSFLPCSCNHACAQQRR